MLFLVYSEDRIRYVYAIRIRNTPPTQAPAMPQQSQGEVAHPKASAELNKRLAA